jgi:hypothetical protein
MKPRWWSQSAFFPWGRYSRSQQSHLCLGIQTGRTWRCNFMHFRSEIQGLSFSAHTPQSLLNFKSIDEDTSPPPKIYVL